MEIYKDNDYAWEEHEMTEHFMDYKNPQVANLLRGYPGGEKIRLGVLFFDKTGRPFFVRHLIDTVSNDDYTTPKRNEAGNHLLKHYDQYSPGGGVNGYAYKQNNGNIISLKVSGLDITDIKDKIGGFAIVRTAIVHRIIGNCLLWPTTIDGSNNVRMHTFGTRAAAGDTGSRRLNAYGGICPERLFDLKNFEIQPGDKLENSIYLKPFWRSSTVLPLGHIEIVNGNYLAKYQKIYEQANSEAPLHDNGKLNESHEILFETKFELGENDKVFDPRTPLQVIKSKSISAGPIKNGFISNHSFFVTKETETATELKGKLIDLQENMVLLLCNVKRDNDNPYGGIGDASIANSIYMTLGHYQEINETVLSDIENAGKWIFDEIQVFGGDTFVNLMSIQRLLMDDNDIGTVNHSIVFPVESIINISMRTGNHVAKDFSYDPTNASLGIRYKTDSHKWEEFNYNDGYSSDDIKDFYLPIPYNWSDESYRSARMRYSLEKSYGESRDTFRVFLPNNLIDIEINNGEITNTREKFGKLIYWQRNTVGYIPINERALTTTPFGEPVQLGVGGVFERFDDVIDKIGNSNQFGLIESDIGFHWFDAVRKIFITLTNSLQLSEDSVVNGLDNFFSAMPDMSQHDNPMFGYGLIGGYDPKNKNVYMSFFFPDGTKKTVGVNLKLNVFTGFYNFPARLFMIMQNNLIGIADVGLKQQAFLHTGKTEFGSYYGETHSAYFELIFVPEKAEPHIFDNLEITANENLCSKMLFDSFDKSVQDVIMDYTTGREIFSKDWNYRNNKWYGNVPFYERQRLVNDYLKIRFIFDSGFTFEQYITMVKLIYRKAL